MFITWQTIITAGAVITAVALIVKYIFRGFSWVERQNKQDEQIKAIKAELAIVTRGMLACLKGLQEQGCDGPVTASVNEIENYLTEQAHRV